MSDGSSPASRLFAMACLGFLSLLLVSIFFYNLTITYHQQTILQAHSLLSGRLAINPIIFGYVDVTYNDQGVAYWPLGLLPAVLIAPVVWLFQHLHLTFTLGMTLPFLTLITFFFALKLAQRFAFSTQDGLFLAFALCLGSVYSLAAVDPGPWFLGHGLSVALTLGALYEWYTRRRLWLIGVAIALVIQTRYMASLVALFFVLELLQQPLSLSEKLRHLFWLSLPIVISVLILGGLNFTRFGNVFDTGYPRALVGESLTASRNKYGYFNVANLPHNLYWYFLATLEPVVEKKTLHLMPPYVEVNLIGYGFFFVSPLFAAILLRFRWTKKTRSLWLVSLLILGILLTHYSTGYVTYGPRYMMDLLPLWYVLLLISLSGKPLNQLAHLDRAIPPQ